MADERQGPGASESAGGPSPKISKPQVSLALRVSRWTTNGLLTAMLLVIALGFGREVLHWWHDEPARPKAAGSESLALATAAPQSQVLAFGNQHWTIQRREFRGPQAKVLPALEALCREAIASTSPQLDGRPDAAERDVLKSLEAEKPVAEQAGWAGWRLYAWGNGFPIMFGIQMSRSAGFPPGWRSLAETGYRVVLWGIAVPVARDTWSLYVFQAGGAEKGGEQAASSIPLPPGGHRLAMIRAEGVAVTAFSADDDLGGAARQFYDRWFAQHGWRVDTAWERNRAGWHARFDAADGTSAVDIRLGADPQGHATGLLVESR